MRRAKEKLGLLEKRTSSNSPRARTSPKAKDITSYRQNEGIGDKRGYRAVGRGKLPS